MQFTVNNALYTTKMGAQIVLLATFKKPIEIDSNIVLFKALHITSKIELDDIVDKGFETLISDIKQAKILVKP